MQGDAHPAKIALRERRERAVRRLTESFARDEIGLEVFESRLEAAYRCTAEADLDALVSDLPAHDEAPAEPIVVAEPVEVIPAAAATALAATTPREMVPFRAARRPTVRAIFSNIERRDHVVVADG